MNDDSIKEVDKKKNSIKKVVTIIGSIFAGLCTVTTIIVNMGQISAFRNKADEINIISSEVDDVDGSENTDTKKDINTSQNVEKINNTEVKEKEVNKQSSEKTHVELGVENAFVKDDEPEVIESADGTVAKPHADPVIKSENLEIIKLKNLFKSPDFEDDSVVFLIDGDISTALSIKKGDTICLVLEPDYVITHIMILPGLASDADSFHLNGRPDELSVVYDGNLGRYYNKLRIDDFVLDFSNPEIKAYRFENPIDYTTDGIIHVNIESISSGNEGYISELYLCGYKKE